MRGLSSYLALAALLSAMPQPVLAGSVSLGVLTTADAQAENVDGCGTDFKRMDGGEIYFDDYETAIIRLNGEIVRLNADHPDSPGDSEFTSADGKVTTRLHWTGRSKTVDEYTSGKGVLTVTADGVSRAFHGSGGTGC